jgi:predicted nucleic acid-binding protein
MNVYVETNFILELAFQQEQASSCESIIALCESDKASLIIPAYCLAEPHEKLHRQSKTREELQKTLDAEIRQLSRTSSYKARLQNIKEIANLLIQSNDDEKKRFDGFRNRLFNAAEAISLTKRILTDAGSYETSLALKPQDAIIYASVISHLEEHSSVMSCFLNRNSKDFDDPNIVAALKNFNCTMIPRFDQGFEFIRKRAGTNQQQNRTSNEI